MSKKNKKKDFFFKVVLPIVLGFSFFFFLYKKAQKKRSISITIKEFNLLLRYDCVKAVYIPNQVFTPVLVELNEKIAHNDIFREELRKKLYNDKQKYHCFFYVPDTQCFYEDIYSFTKKKKGRNILIEVYPSEKQGGMGWMRWILIILAVLFSISMLLFRFIKPMLGGEDSFFMDDNIRSYDSNSENKVLFKDIAGLEVLLEEGLIDLVSFLKNPKKVQKLGGIPPKGYLFIGSPGTAKTMTARAIAGESDVPFYYTSASEFDEMFVGVGPARMRKMFKKADENSPSVIFIDELDAFTKRQSTQGHADSTLMQLLVEMDGFNSAKGVVVIAATNRPEDIDSALTRPGRFGKKFIFHLPFKKGRCDIFKLCLKKIVLSKKVNLSKLAKEMSELTYQFSGADIAFACNEAAIIATRGNKKYVDKSDLEEAIERTVVGYKRSGIHMSSDLKDRVAIHEIGHAVLSVLEKNAYPLHRITIIPRSFSLGHTWHELPEDKILLQTADTIYDNIVVCLGGMVAETLFFKNHSLGNESDLQEATSLASSMVEHGMIPSKEECKELEKKIFIYPLYVRNNLDFASKGELENTKDLLVTLILNKAYIRAFDQLKKCCDAIKRIKLVLLRKETLSRKEFEDILYDRVYDIHSKIFLLPIRLYHIIFAPTSCSISSKSV